MLLGVGQSFLQDNQPGNTPELTRLHDTVVTVVTDHIQYPPCASWAESSFIEVISPTIPVAENLIELTLYLSLQLYVGLLLCG